MKVNGKSKQRQAERIQRDINAQAKAASIKEVGPPPVQAVKVDCGVGKSAATRHHVAAMARRFKESGSGRTIVVAVPRLDLADEQAGLFAGEPDAIAAGLRVAIWRGREAPNPAAHGQQMCQDVDAVKDALLAMVDPQTSVCRRTVLVDGQKQRIECHFFGECAYQRQRVAKADVWFMAHEMLFVPRPEAMGETVALLAVDESAWQDGLTSQTRLSLDTLTQDDDIPGLPIESQRLGFLRRRLHDALTPLPDGPIPHSVIAVANITPENAAEAYTLEWMRKVEVEIYPNQRPSDRKEAVRAASVNRDIRRLGQLWRAMEALASPNAPKASGHAALAVLDTKEGPVRVIHLKGRKDLGAGWQIATLILDAILQPELVKPFWPQLTITADIEVEAPFQYVRQVTDRTYSKSRLGIGYSQTHRPSADNGDAPDDTPEINAPAKPKAALLEVHAIICREARACPGRVLVVVQKALETELQKMLLPTNVELAHHNAVTGRDEWGPASGREGISLMIVVGRTAPSPRAVEHMAEALTGRAITPLPGWYPQSGAYRERENERRELCQTDKHPDPIAEAIRWQICEGELVQIVGRARGVNRTKNNPVVVLLMTNTPLPIAVHDCIPASALTPSPMDMMMAAGALALENPTDAAKAYPEIWKTRDAARSALDRCYDERGMRPKSDYGLAAFSYQLSGHGQRPSSGFLDLNLVPDIAAWLTERLGALVWCECGELSD